MCGMNINEREREREKFILRILNLNFIIKTVKKIHEGPKNQKRKIYIHAYNKEDTENEVMIMKSN